MPKKRYKNQSYTERCKKCLGQFPANTKLNFATLNVAPISYLGFFSMFNCNLNTS